MFASTRRILAACVCVSSGHCAYQNAVVNDTEAFHWKGRSGRSSGSVLPWKRIRTQHETTRRVPSCERIVPLFDTITLQIPRQLTFVGQQQLTANCNKVRHTRASIKRQTVSSEPSMSSRQPPMLYAGVYITGGAHSGGRRCFLARPCPKGHDIPRRRHLSSHTDTKQRRLSAPKPQHARCCVTCGVGVSFADQQCCDRMEVVARRRDSRQQTDRRRIADPDPVSPPA